VDAISIPPGSLTGVTKRRREGQSLRAVLVDDERLAIARLAQMLEKCCDIELAGQFTKCSDLLGQFTALNVDVAFLDIQMPGMNGLELAEVLRQMQPDLRIVFVTAYDHYALDEFRLKDVYYLMKPLNEHALDAAIERILACEEEYRG
jgi:two-component SAPR family response regulator